MTSPATLRRMSVSRPFLDCCAWIVALAILISVLLPMLPHRALARDAAMWTEVCSVAGARLVRVDVPQSDATAPDPGSRQKPMSAVMERCPYCAMHATVPALPPASLSWRVDTALRFEWPSLYLTAPRPLFAWASAWARGPPVSA
ncbi:DUF2946 domain-containing protein [Roseateles sp. SL47]|uniref:DUF2946 domain-containing protein n=1 Tax=Roseateles sp. SL47 TaxID=2995138 RepID=UPI0022717100|nr:DUF2946 domain-containing protein [Roseateles sp. SL47]WAC71009.1 DUF2946 domain-containing protein [Roseateles sp. SL47]